MFKNTRFIVLVILTTIALTSVSSSSLIVAQSTSSNYDLRHYESMFLPIPDANDARWQAVPFEDWEKTFHFLADNANSNLERLSTWNGSYELISGSELKTLATSSSTIKERASSFPTYYEMKQLYSFYRDNENDKSYISYARQGNLTFYNDRYEKEDYDNLESLINIKTNLKAIITPEHLYLYEYERDWRRPGALQQLGYEEFGQKCEILPPDSMCVDNTGVVFDPQFFYFMELQPRYKHWTDLEHGLLLAVRAHKNQTDDTITQRIKVYKATIDGVEWVRIEHGLKREDVPVSIFYFNSKSEYNIVAYVSRIKGFDLVVRRFEYEFVDGVFIPKRFLYEFEFLKPYEYYKTHDPNDEPRKSFRYFNLIKAEVNKPIPDEQFVMDALGLDDKVVISDRIEGNYYAYEKGKENNKPIARFGDLPNGIKTRATSTPTPLWRSPIRVTALCLGLCLLVFGVIYKVRRKRASS